MHTQPTSLPSEYLDLLDQFSQYLLLQRERDPSTAASYCHDAKTFLRYRLVMEDVNLPNLITPEIFPGFVVYLRKRNLNNSTIKRRLIGTMRFWKFLYKQRLITHPPVSLDDMDIIVKKIRNPTEPLSMANFSTLRKEALNGLLHIY
ncbi:MAG: site-specific integrase [Anaerolineales bacterium]|nr:site-specific integrase [Anaerolineales bacterium]